MAKTLHSVGKEASARPGPVKPAAYAQNANVMAAEMTLYHNTNGSAAEMTLYHNSNVP